MMDKTLKLLLFALCFLMFSNAWSVDGLPYQAQPFENLVVSGQPTLEQFNSLSEEGFSTVINLRTTGEFDDFDEAEIVRKLGMNYVHIPVRNVEAITSDDAERLHEAISNASGPVLLHCTVGWRAGSLLAIERFLLHDASEDAALQIAADAHMGHASGDVKAWLKKNAH